MKPSLRRKAFWAIDAFRRPSVRSQLQDLEDQLSAGPQALAGQRERLESLLTHATGSTEHYRPYRGCKELASFPVLQKRHLSEHTDAFQSSAFAGQPLPVMFTSGSTGMPMQFRFSPLKRCRQRAEVIYFSELAGFKLGMRHANVRIIRSKSVFRYWMENQVLFDPSVINEAWLARARKELKHPAMVYLTGYARPISVLASYCLHHGDRPDAFSLSSVVPTAEGLAADERQTIERTFGCRVINRYACQEFGVLAQECPNGKLHLNTASYVFELLSLENDSPAAPGHVGRVVVTDLFSYAMPLIRYDLGDLALLNLEPCPCGNPTPALAELQGRLVEMILDSRGQMLSPFILVNNLREVRGITQFRFLQRTADRYELLLVTAPTFQEEARVKNLLREYLGEKANIFINRVNEIPALHSGKRPYVINEYLKESLRCGSGATLQTGAGNPSPLLGGERILPNPFRALNP
ncbi:MAG: phenylacetate--CoA ligase family protein [Verrucomicrobiae bacterium]|nr:phenylacetate--CoA ligase family protein [Verrucomicrobiae bacterium]